MLVGQGGVKSKFVIIDIIILKFVIIDTRGERVKYQSNKVEYQLNSKLLYNESSYSISRPFNVRK